MKQLIKQQGKKIIAITFTGKTNAFDDRRTATVQWSPVQGPTQKLKSYTTCQSTHIRSRPFRQL
jgi:hypothetical protein|eukprot:4902678-Ditylum_brightwellii.AAC.1